MALGDKGIRELVELQRTIIGSVLPLTAARAE